MRSVDWRQGAPKTRNEACRANYCDWPPLADELEVERFRHVSTPQRSEKWANYFAFQSSFLVSIAFPEI